MVFIKPNPREHCRVCGKKILFGETYEYRVAYRQIKLAVSASNNVDLIEQYATCKACGAEIFIESIDTANKKKRLEVIEKHKKD